jgi:hypothetical protein
MPDRPLTEEQLDAMAEAVADQMLTSGVIETEEASPTAGVRIFVFMRTLPRRARRGLIRGTGHGIALGRKVRDNMLPHLSFREVMAVLTQLAFAAAAAAIVYSLGTWAYTIAPVLGVGMLLAVGAYVALRAYSLLQLSGALDKLAKAVVPQ